MSSTPPLPGIEHVVVLMLENRSFDNVLGGLGPQYPAGTDFDGVPSGWSNPDHDDNPVLASPFADFTTVPDPGESFDDMTHQLFGYHKDILGIWVPNKAEGTPGMQGFCINYHEVHAITGAPQQVIDYFNPDSVPVSSALGLAYGVSDAWFASAPNQTYPNRLFAHCATPGLKSSTEAYLNDTNYFRGQLPDNVSKAYGVIPDLSIFEAIDLQYPGGGAANWKVYYHDSPLSALVGYVNSNWGAKDTPCSSNSLQVVHYDDSDCGPGSSKGATFASDVAADSLPKYAFIEPRYYSNWSTNNLPPNSNHPGDSTLSALGVNVVANGNINTKGPNNDKGIDVRNGEALLLEVYLQLALNPKVFDKTLLIVTYDEHGGMSDHVAPGGATSPFEQPGNITNFAYDRYGVRVPTLFINPRIAANTIFRAPGGGPPLDHTSIIKTLFGQFGLKTGRDGGSLSQLTPRDGAAPDLTGLVSADLARADLPSPAKLKEQLDKL